MSKIEILCTYFALCGWNSYLFC